MPNAAAETAAATAPIEIFAPGAWTDMSGQRWEFTAQHVQDMAAAYDPAVFSAPLVVGHPKTNDPAWGWTKALRYDEASGKLLADPEKVAPEFAEAVRAGRYRKVSAAFFAPGQAGNPKPGTFYLRHVGFLGGAAPAVKGLAPVAFAGDDEFVEFAADAEQLRSISWLARAVGRIARGVRDWLIEEKGQEAADRVISNWDADAPVEIAAELREKAASAEAKPAGAFAAPDPEPAAAGKDENGARKPAPAADPAGEPAFAQGATAGKPAPAQAAAADAGRGSGPDAGQADPLADREARLAEREAAFAAAAAAREAQADEAAFDALIAEGRLAPGAKPHLLAFAAALDAGGEPICFAEGKPAAPAREAFRSFLAAHLGKTISFTEAAPAAGAAFAEAGGAGFAAAITAEMQRAAAAGQPISAAEAHAKIRQSRS